MDLSILVNKRSIRVSTPLPPTALLFEAMNGHEMLGKPFSYEVDLLSQSSEIDLQDLLGERMTVHVDMPHGQRHFNGIVTELQVVGAKHRFIRYRASLRPELELLDYTSDCRIFQNMTVPQIIERIFKNRKVTYLASGLKSTYRPLEYVVQYRESDLNFVSRLMEQEGIFYYFEHEEAKHTLVLLDEVSSCKPAPGYEAVQFFPPDNRDRAKPEHIFSWTAGARLMPGQFTVRDFRYDKPKDFPTGTAKTQIQRADGTARPGAALDVYDFPGCHKTVDEARREAVTRLREQESRYETVEASGDTRGLGVGHHFKVINLPRLIHSDKSYLVVKATYTLQTNSYEGDGTPSGQPEYRVSYTLVDAKCEYRTPRETPKPRVQGPQTATVVGRKNQPQDEEICTDDQGRVMVKFHWDRRGEANAPGEDEEDKDKEQSCFIRVSQAWAGAGWGAMHIPRIGQEVIVDFLEGDPDRPIITGRVYNGDNKTPYPQNPTQSGIKSRSTKGGTADNFNEIRFEDKKGSEELFIQAEKDQTTKVKNNQSISVGADRSRTVGGNESVAVDKDRTVHVKGNQSVTIDGQGQGPVHSTVSVTGKHSLHASDTIDVDAPTHIKLECGGSTIVIEPGKITLSAGGKALVVLDANVFAQSSDGSHVVLDANAFVQAKGGAEVLLDGNVLAKSKDGTELVLDANATIGTSGDATIDAANVVVTGSQKVTAGGASSAIQLAATGASMSGTKATVSGSAMTEITGAIVKIN